MRFMLSIAIALISNSAFAAESRVKLDDIVPVTDAEPILKYVGGGEAVSAACGETQTLVDATCSGDLPPSMSAGFGDLFAGRDRHIHTKTKIVTVDEIKHAECRALNVRPEDVVRLKLQLECQSPTVAKK